MYESSLGAYQLSTGEYFLNVEDIPETPETIKAYIPKLMPNIELGEEANTNIKWTANPSIFINDPECKVTGLTSVLTGQNFITVGHYANEYPNFRSKAVFKDGEYIVEKHNKFALEVQHDDTDSMYFTGKD